MNCIKNFIKTLMLLAIMVTSVFSYAQTVDELGCCLRDNTSGYQIDFDPALFGGTWETFTITQDGTEVFTTTDMTEPYSYIFAGAGEFVFTWTANGVTSVCPFFACLVEDPTDASSCCVAVGGSLETLQVKPPNGEPTTVVCETDLDYCVPCQNCDEVPALVYNYENGVICITDGVGSVTNDGGATLIPLVNGCATIEAFTETVGGAETLKIDYYPEPLGATCEQCVFCLDVGNPPTTPQTCEEAAASELTICEILAADPTNPLADLDCDGGGVVNQVECDTGNDPTASDDDCTAGSAYDGGLCDYLTVYPTSSIATVDCDNGGVDNATECTNGTDPNGTPEDDIPDPCANVPLPEASITQVACELVLELTCPTPPCTSFFNEVFVGTIYQDSTITVDICNGQLNANGQNTGSMEDACGNETAPLPYTWDSSCCDTDLCADVSCEGETTCVEGVCECNYTEAELNDPNNYTCEGEEGVPTFNPPSGAPSIPLTLTVSAAGIKTAVIGAGAVTEGGGKREGANAERLAECGEGQINILCGDADGTLIDVCVDDPCVQACTLPEGTEEISINVFPREGILEFCDNRFTIDEELLNSQLAEICPSASFTAIADNLGCGFGQKRYTITGIGECDITALTIGFVNGECTATTSIQTNTYPGFKACATSVATGQLQDCDFQRLKIVFCNVDDFSCSNDITVYFDDGTSLIIPSSDYSISGTGTINIYTSLTGTCTGLTAYPLSGNVVSIECNP